MTTGPASFVGACVASQGAEPAGQIQMARGAPRAQSTFDEETGGNRRGRDEADDKITPGAASSDAETRLGASARGGL
jgi:hypothetical protein